MRGFGGRPAAVDARPTAGIVRVSRPDDRDHAKARRPSGCAVTGVRAGTAWSRSNSPTVGVTVHIPGRTWNNPISSHAFDGLVDHLDLSPAALVLDVGCGAGEALRRVLDRWGCRGVGVDPDLDEINEARRRLAPHGERVRLEARRIDALTLEEPIDVGICIGASHAFGGPGQAYRPMLRDLRRRLRSSGRLLVGEGYWRQPPAPAYLAATGLESCELVSHAENVRIAESEGLVLHAAIASSPEAWDAFESTSWNHWEARLAESPDDEELRARVARNRAWRRAYIAWGRDTFGFALYVFGLA